MMSPIMRLKMPKISKDSVNYTKKYITSFSSKTRPSPKRIDSRIAREKSKNR